MNNKIVEKSNPALAVVTPSNEQISKLLLPKRFPLPKQDEILVCTLGGVGEIGMNWTLYGHDGRWVLVDAGIAFARKFPSVEAIFLDPSTLTEILPLIDAAIITHAHEDHIGAVHRIWPQISCPIYVTPFAREFLSVRLKEAYIHETTELRTFRPGDRLKIGSFDVQTVHLTHSVPECVGLVFETKAGRVFHTGDWKFDDNPGIGAPVDKNALRKIGDDRVLAMVCDSTNANRPGRATSEGELQSTFEMIMRDHRKSVIVTCFASNVARIRSVMQAADESNRYVALAGRTMETMASIATSQGMMDGVLPLIKRGFLAHCDPHQRVLLCTGTQGEDNATLAKLSRGETTNLPAIEPGDVVVFSSSVIPGNEEDVDRVKDGLRARGAIIVEGDYKGYPIAASGHAKAAEIREMNELIRPRFLIPVHGEPEHLMANASIALSGHVEASTAPEPGQVLSVSDDGVYVVAQVDIALMCQYATSPWEPPVFGPWTQDVREGLLTPPELLSYAV